MTRHGGTRASFFCCKFKEFGANCLLKWTNTKQTTDSGIPGAARSIACDIAVQLFSPLYTLSNYFESFQITKRVITTQHTITHFRQRVSSSAYPSDRSLAATAGSNPRRAHGRPSLVAVVCCRVEMSATDWTHGQRSPTGCYVSVIAKSQNGGHGPLGGCRSMTLNPLMRANNTNWYTNSTAGGLGRIITTIILLIII